MPRKKSAQSSSGIRQRITKPRKKAAQPSGNARRRSSAPKKASAKDFVNIDVFFGAYASSPSGMIEKMKAAKQGYFTLEEWRRGLQPLGADTILKLKSSLPGLQLEVRMPSNFADFHAYAFSYNLTDNEKQRYIDIGTICVLLPLVLGPYFPLQVNALVEYLQAQTEYKTISMDQWMSIYRFCTQITFPDLNGYDPADAWPLLLDNFVEWMKAREWRRARINEREEALPSDSSS
ncbi:DCN1-like protein [Drosera capensis]